MEDINVFKRRYEREKAARIEAESILESKSRELYLVNEQLKTLTADLESIINERTAELQMAHDQAIASSQAKGLFLANMSHEIRTPMNGVLGVLHLLKKTPLNDRQKQLMNTARHSGELLLAIINDILDVSKIEAGELILEKIDFDLPHLLVTMLDSFTHEADKKNLQLLLELDTNLPNRVNGDPTRLRQVISNLLSNAIKFTHQGQITLNAHLIETQSHTTSSTQIVEPGWWIEISVKDTGIGIPPDKIHQIFSPFTQADESITRQFGGTGLGLAICAHLTQAMGEKIQVFSEQNQGTEFRFKLFTSDPVSDHDAHHIAPESTQIFFKNGSVMLVDDNPINREIAQEILEQHGLNVTPLENGKLAVDLVNSRKFDVILMDIQMPVMDGLTATKLIRTQSSQSAETPIIAMTAHAAKEDIAKSLAAGMNGHLTKPLQPEKLIEELTRWITFETQDTDSTLEKIFDEPETPVITGLAVREALARANNNITLFYKTLDRFCSQHKTDTADLTNLLQNKNFDALEKLAHRLKGSSLSIGAKNLAETASQIEGACKQHRFSDLNRYIAEADHQFKSLITAITAETQKRRLAKPSKVSPRFLSSQLFDQFYKSCFTDLKAAEQALSQILCALPPSTNTGKAQELFDQFEMEPLVALLKAIELELAGSGSLDTPA